MRIYVGQRDVTSQYNAFFGAEGTKNQIDGNFSDPEQTTYVGALNWLKTRLTSAHPDQKDDITERFQAYVSLVNSEGCEGKPLTDAYVTILLGLYEELTEYIESDAFASAPQSRQQQLVGLQTECFSMLKQLGVKGIVAETPSGTGTSAEVPPNAPPQAFDANDQLLDSVSLTADSLSFGEQCSADYGDLTNGQGPAFFTTVTGTPNVKDLQPQPFTGEVVNTDYRYGLHKAPAAEQAAVTQQAAPPPDNEEPDVDLTDPLAGLE